ncbi:MAG: AbgT family transporter [Bacteroidales bacterium]|jgi:uncharacterized ion transporter superfamily protein YfcC|nr:AbgT family transporter [Bacteroidales bacterium]
MKKFPHTYVIIAFLLLLATISTWIVPNATPVSWQIFTSFGIGFTKTANIIVFLLIIGGAFWIYNSSKALDWGIVKFLGSASKLERHRVFRWLGANNIIMACIIILFSAFGALFGMSEETIAFVPIMVTLSLAMGYDKLTGVSLCFLAAGLGFAGCILNPFTLGIAQEIVGLPLFSGIEYRILIWLLFTFIGMVFILRHAKQAKKLNQIKPQSSESSFDQNQTNENHSVKGSWLSYGLVCAALILFSIFQSLDSVAITPIILSVVFISAGAYLISKGRNQYMMFLFGFTIACLIVGVIQYEWSLQQIAALFLAFAVISGISLGYGGSKIAKEFLEGAKDMLSAALVVGLASGIIVVLENGGVIAEMLVALQANSGGNSEVGTLGLMYGVQTLLNALITSGSAKAALLMPIFGQVSDLVGLSLQTTVTAFHIGDGFTNLLTPTSGVLIAVLGVAKIDFVDWVRYIWKFILLMCIIGFLVLLPTLYFNLPGF